MTTEHFLKGIQEWVAKSAANEAVSEWLPKRHSEGEAQLKDWLRTLSPHDRAMVQRVARKAVDSAIFGLFCVIDGARTIEEPGPKTEFQLFAVKDDEMILLNEDPLHERYVCIEED